MKASLRSKVLMLYFNGETPETISEKLDIHLSHVTRAINDINVEYRQQKILESEQKLHQIKCIENALFKAIQRKDHSMINELKLSYSKFCV